MYSNNLLDNLAAAQGRKPYIRVGGTTQGFYNFSETQAVQQVQTFTPTFPGPDQPRYITIGPSFFESFHTWPGAKFSFGFGMNTSDVESTRLTARYACKSLTPEQIAYWEMANEPDL